MKTRLATVALLLAFASTTAHAQSIGTSLSGPTSADGAAAYYNPAAMGADDGNTIELDVGLSTVELQYAPPDGSAGSTASPIGPLLSLGGYTSALHPDWRLGMTVGISRTTGGYWNRDDGAADITRYYLVSGQVFHIQATPGVSWTPIEWLTVGLGANLAYGSMSSELDKDFGSQLNQTVGSPSFDSPFPYASPSFAAPVSISGDGFGIGAIGGVLVQPIEELSFGLSVHSPVLVAGSGSLSVDYPASLQQLVDDTVPGTQLPELDGSIDVALDIPMLVLFGASARPHETVELAAYYQFEHASSQPNFNLIVTERTSDLLTNQSRPQAYVDRHKVFFRASFFPVEELQLALHVSYQSNTVPDETMAPNNMDFDRIEFGGAARWQIVPELSVLVQYSHIALVDREITNSLHFPVAQPSLAAYNHPSANGRYTGHANTVRLALGLHL